ncbi:MAG TPA: hypothetical protein VGZ26_12835 [Pirellulales bacterium]|jgi:hypothetical protein|nr:hypothetical protein [Pirellulales bacterium]
MNKISGAILILAAAVSGHGVFVFLASHPQIHKYDVPDSVAKMVLVAIGTSAVLALWGVYQSLKQDNQNH